ncbi:unnamed protein product [Boreogadus saida]
MAGPVCRPRLLDPTQWLTFLSAFGPAGDEESTLGLPISSFMDCSGHSWPSSRPIKGPLWISHHPACLSLLV